MEIDRRSLPDRFLQLRDLDKSQEVENMKVQIFEKNENDTGAETPNRFYLHSFNSIRPRKHVMLYRVNRVNVISRKSRKR